MRRMLPVVMTISMLFLSCSSSPPASSPSGAVLDESKAKAAVQRYLSNDFKADGGRPVKNAVLVSFGPIFGKKASFTFKIDEPTLSNRVIEGDANFDQAQEGKWYLVSIGQRNLMPPLEVK